MRKLKLLKQFQHYLKKVATIPLVTLVLLSSLTTFSANYSQTELRLSFRNTKIESIISFIEKTTDYRFLYQTSQVNLKRKVSINYKGNITNAVNMLFNKTSVYPVIINKQIILKPRPFSPQQRVISGTVTDVDGLPIPDVTVLLNKDEKFVVTDFDGKYSITAKTGDILVFKYLAYQDKTAIIGRSNIVNVVLEEDISLLDEVVLIGYGKEKRANIATAISSVKGKTVQNNLQTGESFDRGLDGLIKGVFVTQGSGELGKGADIIIRGVTSPSFGLRIGNNNNPLYVIDGVAIASDGNFGGTNPLQTINPNDIESVQVLKDAGATAIYGSRGANGVILIKTKGGMYDQPTTVDLSFKTTFGNPVNTLDFLNAAEFKKHILQKGQNTYDFYKTLEGKAKEDFGIQLLNLERFGFYEDEFTGNIEYNPSRVTFGNADTNWNDVVFRTAVTNLLNASVKGGAEKSFYNLSLGYINQEGILRADEKEQYTARFSTQFDISKKFRAGLTVNYSNVLLKSGFSNTNGGQSTTLGAAVLKFRPDLPVYDSNDKLKNDVFTYKDPSSGEKTSTEYANPLAISTLSGQANRSDHSVLANIFGEYNITNDLTFRTEYSYGVSFSNSKTFKPRQYLIGGFDPNASQSVDDGSIVGEILNQNRTKTELLLDNTKSINTTINYTLNYSKEFGKNSMKALVGFSHTEEKADITSSTFQDFSVDLPFPQYASTKLGTTNDIPQSGLNSYFSRLSYNYDDKYGMSAVVRLDRSSRFALENRNAFFPSIAANWNIHKENFLEDSLFNELRLRASAGLTGSTSVGEFQYIQRFNNSGTTNYNGQPSFAFAQGFANNRLKWETTEEYNLGLDFETKNRILRGSVDFYHRTTSDVISNEYEVVETSADQTPKNNATIQNKGFEISLGSDIINNENFTWSVNANASKNLNKVVKVSGAVTTDIALSQFYVVGREVNLLKGYIVNGIIQTQDRIDQLNANAPQGIYDLETTAPGDYEYKDVNGDGKIDGRDITILGSRQPDLFGGFNTNMTYKGFQLGANFSYAIGLESFRFNSANNSGRFFNVERHLAAENRWSPTNTSATLPRLIHVFGEDTSPNTRNSSANIYDASYLRLTSLRLGYNLPSQTISNLGFSRVNVYIAGTNLITWTSFPGLDPQGVDGGGADAGNTDNFDAYPTAKTFSMGLNLQF